MAERSDGLIVKGVNVNKVKSSRVIHLIIHSNKLHIQITTQPSLQNAQPNPRLWGPESHHDVRIPLGLGQQRERNPSRSHLLEPCTPGRYAYIGYSLRRQQNYWARNWRATLLFGPNPNSTSPNLAVKRPTDFTRLWWESNDHSWHMGSVWRPIAPPGYVALGDLMVYSVSKPSLDYLWCLRADLVKPANYWPSDIWNDRGSGRSIDISVLAVVPEAMGLNGNEKIPLFADTFIHSASYSPPNTGLAFVPVLDLGNEFKEFDQSVPTFTKTSIPNTGKTYAMVEQAAVTLPTRCFFASDDTRTIAQIANPFISLSKAVAWNVEGVRKRWEWKFLPRTTHQIRYLQITDGNHGTSSWHYDHCFPWVQTRRNVSYVELSVYAYTINEFYGVYGNKGDYAEI
ncbi:hypothetical protein BELL_0336g00100 [Botrytis elliptica]|uniref:Insecticidal crystal toxin domain-containing protein n=1 Tax=Botrytis elliptica TaxID=278938 RepID=A0A4Z1JK87_9HELO|nr:hypothetical protein BELL_0336g00100 [Botrytis elliptica]